MSTSPDEMSNEELARHLMDLNTRAAVLNSQADEIKAVLRDRAKNKTGTREYGELELRVTANRRFSASKAKKLLPANLLSRIMEEVPSSKKARALKESGALSEDLYNSLMDEHPHKIGVGFRKSEDDE